MEKMGSHVSERPPITAEALLEDNRSLEAQRRMNEWWNYPTKGLLFTCSDARVGPYQLIPERLGLVSSVAAALPPSQVAHLLRDERFNYVIVLGHHGPAKKGESPTGCGGLGVKKQQEGEEKMAAPSQVLPARPEDFVRTYIESSDVVVQTFTYAEKVAGFTDKPVVAAVVDHTTGEIRVLAFFRRGKTEHIAFHRDHKRIPPLLYAKGVPSLSLGNLPEDIRDLLERGSRVGTQEVQNPPMVLLTYSPVPPEVRYPHLCDGPNKVFRVTIPPEVIGPALENKEVLNPYLAQILYPLGHNLNSHDGSFSGTKILVIEGRNLQEAEGITKILAENETIRQWLKKGGKIVLAQLDERGKTEAVRNFQV